jgi:hypothetical protein
MNRSITWCSVDFSSDDGGGGVPLPLEFSPELLLGGGKLVVLVIIITATIVVVVVAE